MLGRQAYCFIVFAIAAYVSAPSAADARTHRLPTDYGTIQAGIDAASEGDTVLVAPGTYTGEGNKELDFKSHTPGKQKKSRLIFIVKFN